VEAGGHFQRGTPAEERLGQQIGDTFFEFAGAFFEFAGATEPTKGAADVIAMIRLGFPGLSLGERDTHNVMSLSCAS